MDGSGLASSGFNDETYICIVYFIIPIQSRLDAKRNNHKALRRMRYTREEIKEKKEELHVLENQHVSCIGFGSH